MDFQNTAKGLALASLLVILAVGCAAPVRTVTQPPPFPDSFMRAGWGSSVEEVKTSIRASGGNLFEDRTNASPFALYVEGAYLGRPAIVTYFFTPKSKELFRVDVTYHDPQAYQSLKNELVQTFKSPSFSQKDVDHWSWPDRSLIILQRDASDVQISYSSGRFSIVSYREGSGLLR